MIDFNNKDKDILLWILKYAKEKVLTNASEEQLNAFTSLSDKIKLVIENDIDTNLSLDDFETIKVSQEKLDQLCQEFYNSPDITDPHEYDRLQREVLQEMDFYSTLREKFRTASDYLREAVTKEHKSRIASCIANEDGISQTQANVQVERDLRYITLRDEYLKIKRITSAVNAKFEQYSKAQKALMQALSLASKSFQRRD